MNALEKLNTQTGTLSTTSSQKSEQIAHMVQQCFAIQDTYGKSPDQLKTLMKVMIEDLQPFSLERIQSAFRIWRQESTKIPTPADILKLISPQTYTQPEYPEDRPSDYQRLTPEEKANLDNYLARARRAIESGEFALSKPNVVPWYGKNWSEMDEAMKQKLRAHITNLIKDKGQEEAYEYMLHLKKFHKVPHTFYQFEEGK